MAEIRRDGGDAPPAAPHSPDPVGPAPGISDQAKKAFGSDPATNALRDHPVVSERVPDYARLNAMGERLSDATKAASLVAGEDKALILDKLAEPLEHLGDYKQAWDATRAAYHEGPVPPKRDTTEYIPGPDGPVDSDDDPPLIR
jgi:hypothetical protein